MSSSSRRPATMDAVKKISNHNGSNEHVVVATFLHVCSCKDCGKKMKRVMEKKQGVKSAEIIDRSAARATGAFDPEELGKYISMKTGMKNLVLLKPNGARCGSQHYQGEEIREEEKVISSTRHDQNHIEGPQKEEAPAPARREAPAKHENAAAAAGGPGDKRRKVAVFEMRSDKYRRSVVALLIPRIVETPGAETVQFDVVSGRMTVEGYFDIGELTSCIYKMTEGHLRLAKLDTLPEHSGGDGDVHDGQLTNKPVEEGGDDSPSALWWWPRWWFRRSSCQN